MEPVLGDTLSVSSTGLQNLALGSPRTPRFAATPRTASFVTPRTARFSFATPRTARFSFTPRTSTFAPRTPRSAVSYGGKSEDELGDEDEITLLGEEQRRQYEADVLEDGFGGYGPGMPPPPISWEEKCNMALLCILYLIQGIPLGLALGSMPFILQNQLSYSQLATFALSGYPYSLKLLWSPIVDSVFFSSIGRRKSWIIPMQLTIGTLMLYISHNIQRLMDDPSQHVTHLTNVFTALVFFSATQDIAVDGWALTLLSPENLSYASTCQTIGLNSGYFTSYTVFLALNSEAIASKWGLPRLTLAAYLKFWCLVSYSVSIWLLFKKERAEPVKDISIKEVYKQIWNICKMRHVQALMIMFVFGKIGFAANDAATSLKMVEKGLKREDLAVAVLINFPFQIVGGWLVGSWSRGEYPLRPWLYTFWPRMLFAFTAMLIVYWFPKSVTPAFFVFLVVNTVLTSFTSTIQFVGSSAFFTRISDPVIGGTYMTLLNTFSNIGTMWPKWFVLKSVDMYTIATCQIADDADYFGELATECVSKAGKKLCADIGGECLVIRDGYYFVSTACLAFGVIFMVLYTIPTAWRLQGLPLTAWRVKL
ncbi:MFS general substrate transporter [Roridomyces roridus]|uniref:MFS general substrate transporter n=1 Tax=Roridomyces roridus TaxID=1738132 RepID=A0AAD7FTD7_9AGAR|nr:MFS general substrate transporter [Roridomyces roridus]